MGIKEGRGVAVPRLVEEEGVKVSRTLQTQQPVGHFELCGHADRTRPIALVGEAVPVRKRVENGG